MAFKNSDDSDQPGHPPIVIRVIGRKEPQLSSSRQLRLIRLGDLRLIEPRCEKTGLGGGGGVPTRSDTNQTVQLYKMARSSKFRI